MRVRRRRSVRGGRVGGPVAKGRRDARRGLETKGVGHRGRRQGLIVGDVREAETVAVEPDRVVVCERGEAYGTARGAAAAADAEFDRVGHFPEVSV